MNTIRRIFGFPILLFGAVIFQAGFLLLDQEMQELFAERIMFYMLKK